VARAPRIVEAFEVIARSVSLPCARAEALAGLAGSLATVGEREWARHLAIDAETIARTAENPEWDEDPALVNLAGALAAAGDLDRAESVAEAITDGIWYDVALAGIERSSGPAGDPASARAIADALRSQRWQDCLTVLARNSPPALFALADDYLDLVYQMRRLRLEASRTKPPPVRKLVRVGLDPSSTVVDAPPGAKRADTSLPGTPFRTRP